MKDFLLLSGRSIFLGEQLAKEKQKYFFISGGGGIRPASTGRPAHAGRTLLSKKQKNKKTFFTLSAEAEGFEPPVLRNRTTVFKTAAFDHSATPPGFIANNNI